MKYENIAFCVGRGGEGGGGGGEDIVLFYAVQRVVFERKRKWEVQVGWVM